MANEIQELLGRIADDRVRTRLATAIGELKKTKKFGLIFEEHLPELLPIYGAKIVSGARVARKGAALTDTYSVRRVARGNALVTPEQGSKAEESIPASELVVVKRFGEAIFPRLRLAESVLRGEDAPHHTLIEADNYHALQLLEWLYPGKVDCIYIDPPYNTGARDWKYNNDYVDVNDAWRHSKWLAFMERRLKLAKRLLNPETGVLIVTVDEHEVHHLRMLLEQTYPDTSIQMVTIVITPGGVTQGRFSRVEEYALFCFNRSAFAALGPDDLLSTRDDSRTGTSSFGWQSMIRRGVGSSRDDRRGMFFPIYVDPTTRAITGAGEPLPPDQAPKWDEANIRSVAWPIRSDGTLGRWRVGPSKFKQLLALGYVKLGRFDEKRRTWTVLYLQRKTIADIEAGKLEVLDRDEITGAVNLAVNFGTEQLEPLKTVWNRSAHHAGSHGSTLLRNILGGSAKFDFPKSVYATRDAISAIVRDLPGALILDFFAGSGTTLHAVLQANAQDNGRRRCILVTNNEVAENKARELSLRGLEPGMPDWEKVGICQSVTFPRCKFVINGKRDDGVALPGTYLTGIFEDQKVRRNYRTLDFTSAVTLSSRKARESFASAIGFSKSKVSGDEDWLMAEDEPVTVLLDPGRLLEFCEHGSEWAEGIETVYLPFKPGKALDQAKRKLEEAWTPLTRSIEKKGPMKNGFVANLDYFRLDFLDRALVETGGKLADLLPTLWMMAGCRGKLPTCTGREDMLLFRDCPFAVLIDETSLKLFLDKLSGYTDIEWVFLVTNDQENFARMSERLPECVPVNQRIHLWRNYLDNCLINVDSNRGDAP